MLPGLALSDFKFPLRLCGCPALTESLSFLSYSAPPLAWLDEPLPRLQVNVSMSECQLDTAREKYCARASLCCVFWRLVTSRHEKMFESLVLLWVGIHRHTSYCLNCTFFSSSFNPRRYRAIYSWARFFRAC